MIKIFSQNPLLKRFFSNRQFSIKPYQPVYEMVLIILAFLAIPACSWFYINKDQETFFASSLYQDQDKITLQRSHHQLQEKATTLQKRITMLSSETNLQKQTMEHLQEVITKQQDDLYTLRSELSFYQGVMTSVSESRGLAVQGLYIEKTSYPRRYDFKLLLTHITKNDKLATGKLSILLEGLQSGIIKTIDINELPVSDGLPLTFEFSNFERITGSILIPEDFTPHRVIVQLYLKEDTAITTKQIFDWLKVIVH